ncbi:hypothetical protein JCM17846_23840 [Iodidimonas nitroreducens]|uniref:Uncharacterized protein n=2 Tax=Iodidimonas nitroreducens TaxID=1236968 RepID=A0A5A7N8N4_9PROT|nr:hypothetical protein JCM17846_23840 [Iodidimonas nitroreducens]
MLILLALLAGGLMIGPAQAQQDGRIDEMPLDQRSGKSVPRGPRALSNDPMMDDPLEPLLMPDYQSVTDAETKAQAKRYHDCMRQALKAPDQARIEAMAWLSDGASIPALHCLASALVTLGDYDAAAQNFTSLADQMRTGRGVTYNILAADDPIAFWPGFMANWAMRCYWAIIPPGPIPPFPKGLPKPRSKAQGLFICFCWIAPDL